MQTPLSAGLKLRVGGCSNAGVKAHNQDAFAVHMPDDHTALVYKGAVTCVADGVSCATQAQLASHTSVAQFIDDYYATPQSWSVKKSAAKVLTSLNSWLFHHGQQAASQHNDMLTTFTAVVFKSASAHIIHAGDSRAYLLRNGELQQLTWDHSLRGRTGLLTRALGMDSRLDMDYLQHDLCRGDRFVLTSDGVHDWIQHNDMQRLLMQPETDLEVLAEQIVDAAKEQQSDDNLSCLIVDIEEVPDDSLEELHRQLVSLAIPPVLDVGNRIDHYQVERVMYNGTRSHLYLVTDTHSQKHYVLKAPSVNFQDDFQALKSFNRELWVAGQINSPYVMKIVARPQSSPFLYHLCEYVPGQTLRQWMHDNPQPDLQQVREIVGSVIKGVRALQRMGMVHRDLKPENLMISPQGNVVLIDFGTVLADGLDEIQHTASEDIPVGSVDYIAPEYLCGSIGTHTSDIYSLAVIFYEMLTGELPYKLPDNLHADPKRHIDWRFRSLRLWRDDIPLWLDRVIEKACHPHPQKRYQAMSEFIADVHAPNLKLTTACDDAPLIERNPLLFWQALSAVLFVVAVLLLGVLMSR